MIYQTGIYPASILKNNKIINLWVSVSGDIETIYEHERKELWRHTEVPNAQRDMFNSFRNMAKRRQCVLSWLVRPFDIHIDYKLKIFSTSVQDDLHAKLSRGHSHHRTMKFHTSHRVQIIHAILVYIHCTDVQAMYSCIACMLSWHRNNSKGMHSHVVSVSMAVFTRALCKL